MRSVILIVMGYCFPHVSKTQENIFKERKKLYIELCPYALRSSIFNPYRLFRFSLSIPGRWRFSTVPPKSAPLGRGGGAPHPQILSNRPDESVVCRQFIRKKLGRHFSTRTSRPCARDICKSLKLRSIFYRGGKNSFGFFSIGIFF